MICPFSEVVVVLKNSAEQYREALAWHLYQVLHLIQMGTGDCPEILEGIPDADLRILHLYAYEVSVRVTEGCEPVVPKHIVETLAKTGFQTKEYSIDGKEEAEQGPEAQKA